MDIKTKLLRIFQKKQKWHCKISQNPTKDCIFVFHFQKIKQNKLYQKKGYEKTTIFRGFIDAYFGIQLV